MQLHDLKPDEGSKTRRKKIGRGPGSGHGKTSTKGHKGQKARNKVNPNFEGGQTALHRRLPHMRGFKAVNKKFYALVNVEELDVFENGDVVSPETLIEKGILKDVRDGVKILGDGEIAKKLTVSANKFSASAIAKLEAAGGTVTVL